MFKCLHLVLFSLKNIDVNECALVSLCTWKFIWSCMVKQYTQLIIHMNQTHGTYTEAMDYMVKRLSGKSYRKQLLLTYDCFVVVFVLNLYLV